ncbi:MAG: glucose-6-phosphate dehydrogenase [Candidatus Latescibacteria bacterium]|nr:glucose-6-phosphate dehydrogenase [Candidatus Latescibacterota bacterium]
MPPAATKTIDVHAGLRDVSAAQRAGSCVMTIFGGAGDLAKRKIVPAMYNAAREGLTPPGFTIVGTGRGEMSHDQYRDLMRDSIREFVAHVDEDTLRDFLAGLYWVGGDFGDPALYVTLEGLIQQCSEERTKCDNRMYYLSTPPSVFVPIVQQLGAHNMARVSGSHHWRRIIIEKPFGRDLESAKTLNREIGAVFEEWQVYRIDHYLGKETVQNITALRFANGIFEPLWNRNYINHVQITAAESIGVEGRGGYYEESGALRDMVQNHLLQVLTLVAIEPPSTFDANAVRDEKAKVLRAMRPYGPEDVDRCFVRAQYDDGLIQGKPVIGYRKEDGVSPTSMTETFVAAQFFVDNWRWADVPFYIRTGKRLPKRVSEVAIFFKRTPHLMFRRMMSDEVAPNVLALQIQPDESIAMQFEAKFPGPQMELRSVKMNFQYKEAFQVETAEAYERLILDCLRGDATLFMRRDAVEVGWWLVMPVLERWQNQQTSSIPAYPSGSWGPKESEDLLARDGRLWRTP